MGCGNANDAKKLKWKPKDEKCQQRDQLLYQCVWTWMMKFKKLSPKT